MNRSAHAPVRLAVSPPETKPSSRGRLISQAAASEIAGVPRRTIAAWIRQRRIASVVYNRAADGRVTLYAVDRASLESFIADHRQEPTR